jgi:tetratricopeptide (TPR) repeat protein
MRSRKKSRQKAESAAGIRSQNDESTTEPAAQSDAFGAPVDASSAASQDALATQREDVVFADVEGAVLDMAEERAAAPAGPVPEPEVLTPLAPKEMLAHLRQRVLDNPNDVQARLRLGELHDRRNEPLLALEQYQAACNEEPDNALVVLQYAQALTALNRFAEAERELRRVLKLEPDHGGLHLQLGTISFRRGLYSQAEIELKRALELLPDAASAYFHRGESLNQLSRIDEALDMLERGVALDPTYSRAYYIMGILYDRKSRPQEAGAMYKKAREVSGT